MSDLITGFGERVPLSEINVDTPRPFHITTEGDQHVACFGRYGSDGSVRVIGDEDDVLVFDVGIALISAIDEHQREVVNGDLDAVALLEQVKATPPPPTSDIMKRYGYESKPIFHPLVKGPVNIEGVFAPHEWELLILAAAKANDLNDFCVRVDRSTYRLEGSDRGRFDLLLWWFKYDTGFAQKVFDVALTRRDEVEIEEEVEVEDTGLTGAQRYARRRFFVAVGFPFPIYGTEDDSPNRVDHESIDNGTKRGLVFGQWFSNINPKGGWGSNDIRYLKEISEEEFEAARARGWT